MFDFLKKKISNFKEKLQGKIEEKEDTKAIPEPQPQPTSTEPKPIIEPEKNQGKKETTPKEEIEHIEEKKEPQQNEEKEQPQQKEISEEKKEIYDAAGTSKKEEDFYKQEEKRKLAAKEGIAKKLKGLIGAKIKISGKDVENFFDEFELSLLESDVEQETAEAIVKELKEQLIGKEISARENTAEFLKKEIKEALEKIMETETINFFEQKKPCIVMFIGPNGAGKTTTIAKISQKLKEKGKTSIIAAGDTFRAASIEQLEEHAKRVGVKVVKHGYGADSAAVAFDAIKAAEAKKIDYVLIDTAGRQETSKNLMQEMEKLSRVTKPNLKIYIGEAFTGQALLEQAGKFNETIGIDGFILTKMDSDAKGGTAISLLHKLKKPIIFIGTGQRYEDLIEFKPEFITNRII